MKLDKKANFAIPLRAKQAAEKLCTGRESNTQGLKPDLLFSIYDTTKVVP